MARSARDHEGPLHTQPHPFFFSSYPLLSSAAVTVDGSSNSHGVQLSWVAHSSLLPFRITPTAQATSSLPFPDPPSSPLYPLRPTRARAALFACRQTQEANAQM